MIMTELVAYRVAAQMPLDFNRDKFYIPDTEVSFWLPDLGVYFSEDNMEQDPHNLCKPIENILKTRGCHLKVEVNYVGMPNRGAITRIPLEMFLKDMNILSAHKYSIVTSQINEVIVAERY